jgi:DNA-binding NarL/FixJ family response regulator
VNAQDNVNSLLDSLASETNRERIMDLNLKIASELKFQDKSRTTYYVNLALTEAQKINSEKTWKEFYERAVEIYTDMDALDLALDYLLKEYDFYKDSKELKRFELENKLGIINARLNNPEKALDYFKGILPHYKKEEKYDLVGKTYNNIGLAYLSIEKPDSSLYFLQQGLKFIEKDPDLNVRVHLKTNLARSYAALKKDELAERNFVEATEILNESTNPGIITWVNTERAKFYLTTENYEKAIEFAEKAQSTSLSKNNFIYAQILRVLSIAQFHKGNYKKSAEYFNLYDQVRDNLNIEEKAVNVEKLKIEYDYKIREKQLEIDESRKRMNLLLAIGGLTILLLVLSLFMIRYRNRLEKEKLANQLKESREKELKLELELKNKELASKTIRQTEHDELINLVQKDLKEIQAKARLSETKQALNQLVNKIKSNALQNNWEEFELRFSNVYESFYEKLDELHPHLNSHDKRICALIKLNLTTKEIANLTKTSIKSVENTRTRLRKKLGLTHLKIDLSKYLSEF